MSWSYLIHQEYYGQKFDDQEIGMKLALTGAIKDQLLHLDDLTIYGLDFFARYYPGQIRLDIHLLMKVYLVAN